MERFESSRNSTLTCVHCPWEPVRPIILVTCESIQLECNSGKLTMQQLNKNLILIRLTGTSTHHLIIMYIQGLWKSTTLAPVYLIATVAHHWPNGNTKWPTLEDLLLRFGTTWFSPSIEILYDWSIIVDCGVVGWHAAFEPIWRWTKILIKNPA